MTWKRKLVRLMRERNACDYDSRRVKDYIKHCSTLEDAWARCEVCLWFTWLAEALGVPIPEHDTGMDCWCWNPRTIRKKIPFAAIKKAFRAYKPLPVKRVHES